MKTKKMNAKKTLTVLAAALLSIVSVSAANNERGIDLYRAGLYDAAKLYFLSQTNQAPNDQAENYYYLARTYSELGQSDSTAYYFDQAVAVAPEYPMGYVGQGQMALEKRNRKEAQTLFNKAAKLEKKNPEVPVAIAEVYILLDELDPAKDWLSKARKIDKKYSGIYMTEGDLLLKQNNRNMSEVYSMYVMALSFNPQDKLAYLKLAKAYEPTLPEEALNYLDQLLAVDPEYIPAYSEIGQINAKLGLDIFDDPNLSASEAITKAAPYLGKALLAYEKFVSIPGVPFEYKGKYAELLNLTQQYDKSMVQVRAVLEQDPTNVVMRRLEGYNYFRMKQYDLAIPKLQEFLQTVPTDRHIYRDYQYTAQALLEEERPAEAVEYYNKAIAMNPEQIGLVKELADAYKDMADFDNAIVTYEKYFEVKPTVGEEDYLSYGRTVLFYAVNYNLKRLEKAELTQEEKDKILADTKRYMELGTQAFDKVLETIPTLYQALLWRAQINVLLDMYELKQSNKIPGYAKPYYEAAIAVFEDPANNEEGKRNKDLLEGYNYLASYYLLIDNTKTMIEYYQKILVIDPENQTAKRAIEMTKKAR